MVDLLLAVISRNLVGTHYVCLTPCVLDAMIQGIYAKAIPSLGVNRKIKKQ
jgi:hypothetical protein